MFCLKLPKPFPRWQYLFLITDPDSVYIWYLGILLLSLSSIIYFFSAEIEETIIKKTDYITINFWALGALMSLPMPYSKYIKRSSLRIFVGFGLLCSISLNVTYCTEFFNILLKPRYPPKLYSISDVLSQNHQLISTEYTAVRAHFNIKLHNTFNSSIFRDF